MAVITYIDPCRASRLECNRSQEDKNEEWPEKSSQNCYSRPRSRSAVTRDRYGNLDTRPRSDYLHSAPKEANAGFCVGIRAQRARHNGPFTYDTSRSFGPLPTPSPSFVITLSRFALRLRKFFPRRFK